MSQGNLPYSEYSREKFSFRISLNGLEPSAVYTSRLTSADYIGVLETDSFTSSEQGTAVVDIELSHNQSYRILDIPLNASYSITENEVSFYTAEYRISGNEGALITKANDISNKTKTALSTLTETVDAEDLDVHVRFINHFIASDYELPSAGFDDSRPMRTLIFAAALIFGSLIVYRRRRRIR